MNSPHVTLSFNVEGLDFEQNGLSSMQVLARQRLL